jgi:hypothetical protein
MLTPRARGPYGRPLVASPSKGTLQPHSTLVRPKWQSLIGIALFLIAMSLFPILYIEVTYMQNNPSHKDSMQRLPMSVQNALFKSKESAREAVVPNQQLRMHPIAVVPRREDLPRSEQIKPPIEIKPPLQLAKDEPNSPVINVVEGKQRLGEPIKAAVTVLDKPKSNSADVKAADASKQEVSSALQNATQSATRKDVKLIPTSLDVLQQDVGWRETHPLARGIAGRPMNMTPGLIGAQRARIECDINVDSVAYWNDPVGDADRNFVSPFAVSEKFLAFSPDFGGWNNVR